MSNRRTGQPCPCGSGLPGKRTLRVDCSQYVACSQCYERVPPKQYRECYDEDAKRQAAARRRLEEMRDAE